MAGTAFLRYSKRISSKKSGGRYDLQELWQVPNIKNTGGGDDSPVDSWQNEALNADGLPDIGDVDQDGGYVCVSLAPRSLDDQGTADVDVRWQEDPLTLPTEVHYFSASKTKPAWQGRAVEPPGSQIPDDNDDDLFDGDPIQDIRNSAGDRYNPPVTYEAPLERIEIVCRVSLLWHDTGESPGGNGPTTDFEGNWDEYLKHWNKSDYVVTQNDPDNPDNTSTRTFPAGTLMLADKRAPLIKEPYFHRLLTVVFLYDPDMWGQRVPDMGPRCLKHLSPNGSGGVTLKAWTSDGRGRGSVTDALGRPFSGSAELDGSGNQLLPNNDGSMPQAVIYQWWPVDDDGDLFSAEFDDLQLFFPERNLNV